MLKPNLDEARKRDSAEIEYNYLKENFKTITNDKLFFLRTYGCQMNVHDSEQIRYYLKVLGFKETDDIKLSDVVVLNTCAIRENVKDKIVGFLSISKHLKETTKPDLTVVLMGCLTQLESEVNYFLEKHSYIDLILGTHNIHELPKLLINKDKQTKVYSNSNKVLENINYKRDSNITAWINITYGCNNFCTYCIVPYTRGKERSRKKEDILKEVNELIDLGYKEITLLGQNVNSYGNDFSSDYSFSDLLEEVANQNIKRIRFVTSNPWNFSDDLIKVISKHKNIMPYIHLPVQSGSNDVLKKMNRGYTKEEYIKLYDKLKSTIPNVAITTDIIVGFPNETDEDFNETIELVNHCKFDGAFTFIYSKRDGTPASLMKDNISEVTKKERLTKLNNVINKYSLANNKKLLNQTVDVLFLGTNEKNSEMLYGYTETMKLVNVISPKSNIGKIKKTKIKTAKTFSLDGILI